LSTAKYPRCKAQKSQGKAHDHGAIRAFNWLRRDPAAASPASATPWRRRRVIQKLEQQGLQHQEPAMTMPSLFLRSAAITLSLAAILSVALSGRAGAQDVAAGEMVKVRPADRAAVAACLKFVAAADARRTEGINKKNETEEPKPEKLDPAAWHAQTGERAAADAASCIGVVSEPCQASPEGVSNLGMTDCIRRELAVWNERLNGAYKKWIDGCDDKKVCEARRKLGRAWLAKRDARCALPWIETKGTMAIPMTSYCFLDQTAHQAIWLEGHLQ
jgi:uncharacterized protein YecT (DUF1311 family)